MTGQRVRHQAVSEYAIKRTSTDEHGDRGLYAMELSQTAMDKRRRRGRRITQLKSRRQPPPAIVQAAPAAMANAQERLVWFHMIPDPCEHFEAHSVIN